MEPPVVIAPPPPPLPPKPQEQFGAGFLEAFEAERFDEPIDPVASDIIDIDKTADPIDIPDPI